MGVRCVSFVSDVQIGGDGYDARLKSVVAWDVCGTKGWAIGWKPSPAELAVSSGDAEGAGARGACVGGSVEGRAYEMRLHCTETIRTEEVEAHTLESIVYAPVYKRVCFPSSYLGLAWINSDRMNASSKVGVRLGSPFDSGKCLGT